MSAIENTDAFVRNYSHLMLGVWKDDSELSRLLADPTGYATEKGLPVASGATVTVDRSQPESLFTKDQVVADWTKTPGRHILHVPEAPLVDMGELTEEQLETVAGGGIIVIVIIL